MNDNDLITGRVVSVNISSEKGTSKTPAPEIRINEFGIEGDAHSGPWHRQVSLLAEESIARFSLEHNGKPFGFGDFAENITTRGLDLTSASLLDRFIIGAVELEMTQMGKKCHGDGCAIYQEVGRCVMPKEGIFCRVVRGGALKAGDEVHHKRKRFHFHVITLSDRASKGIYADLSGPCVCRGISEFCGQKKWRSNIESTLLPDDANLLEKLLRSDCDAGMDVVITTGGTGIGPRDIVPEVVTSMADKLIPGVMEHVRAVFGAGKPGVFLSRSVAAVCGKTLIFTLPGSVKAVEEYLSEITKILDHAVYMVHGLDVHS